MVACRLTPSQSTYVSGGDRSDEGDEDEDLTCHTCFNTGAVVPLSVHTFNIMQEWFYDVPLPIRLLLEPFISARSLKRSIDKENLVRRKLEKLYTVYDSLLNVHSFLYSGLLQQANSDELVMGYKSAETVFKVASRAGTSHSLTTAERSLKQRAINDDMYYDTFLKEYPHTYETMAGVVTKGVRMRDCHVVFMMDNLVRLKFTDDPDRGECRSKQMDTLPITVQGLPKDSVITESWHEAAICDGTTHCPCKDRVHLTTDDIPHVLFQLTKDEQSVITRYKKLCTWGLLSSLDDIFGGKCIYM